MKWEFQVSSKFLVEAYLGILGSCVKVHEHNKLKNTQKAQTSTKAAHYPHIARIHDLESQHGDIDHLQKFSQYAVLQGFVCCRLSLF